MKHKKTFMQSFGNLSSRSQYIILLCVVVFVCMVVYKIWEAFKNPLADILKVEQILNKMFSSSMSQCISCKAGKDENGNTLPKPCSIPFLNFGCLAGITIIVVIVAMVFAKIRSFFPKSSKEQAKDNLEAEMSKSPGAYDEMKDELFEKVEENPDVSAKELAEIVGRHALNAMDAENTDRVQIRQAANEILKNIFENHGDMSPEEAQDTVDHGGTNNDPIIPE